MPGCDLDLEAVKVARLLVGLGGLDQLPVGADRVLQHDQPLVRRAVLDRVGLRLAQVVARGQLVVADAEDHVGAGRLLDVGLDLGPLVEGVAEQPFLVGLQVEDARVAGVGAARRRR